MSAPDVERLVDRTPQEEAFDMLYRIRGIVGGIGAPDTIGKLDEQVQWMKEALNLHRSTIADLNAKLTALSAHPDPLPASADIAGRLITGALWASKWINDGCRESAYHEDEFLKLEAAVEAYRANPSGWIPVGERLPEEGKRVLLSGHASDDPEEIDVVVLDQGEWLDKWGNVYDIDGTKWQPLPPPPQEGQKADAEKACDENCSRCSGEYCNIHGSYGCECDCIARHS